MAALTVERLVALLADAVSFADSIKLDAGRGGAELQGDELEEARAAIAEHEATSKAIWRVTVREARGYFVWTLTGTLYDVIEANDRQAKTLGCPVEIVNIARAEK